VGVKPRRPPRGGGGGGGGQLNISARLGGRLNDFFCLVSDNYTAVLQMVHF
jgi:hypothetical protein